MRMPGPRNCKNLDQFEPFWSITMVPSSFAMGAGLPSGCMMAELGKLGSPQGGWEALYRLLSRVPFFNPIQSKGGVWSAPQPKIGSAIVRAPTRSLAGSSSALYPASSLPPRALWCALGPLPAAAITSSNNPPENGSTLFQNFSGILDCQRSIKENQNQRSQLGMRSGRGW